MRMRARECEGDGERKRVTRVVNGNVRHKNIKNFGKTKKC